MSEIFKIIIAFSVTMCACTYQNKDVSASTTEKGLTISNVLLKDLNDQTIDPGKYKGKTVFINIWATWCKPCLEEMPSIEKAQNILKNDDIVFLLASAENNDEIEAFRNAHGYKFNYVRIENSEALGIQALPTTFIFNRQGQLVFSEEGYREWDEEKNIVMIRNIANEND